MANQGYTRYKNKKKDENLREMKVKIAAHGVKFQKEGYVIFMCVIISNPSRKESEGERLTCKGHCSFLIHPSMTLVVSGVPAKQKDGRFAGGWYLSLKTCRDACDDLAILKRVVLSVHGVGEKSAVNIINTVTRYQERIDELKKERISDLQTVLKDPKILLCAGLSRERASFVYKAIQDHLSNNSTLAFLYKLDLTDRVIALIKNFFGGLSHKVLLERCFELTEVKGVGFLTAARIADEIGIPRNAPHRIKAAILYALDSSLSDGSCYCDSSSLSKEICTLIPGISPEEVSDTFKVLFSDCIVVDSGCKIRTLCEDTVIPDSVLSIYDSC